VTPLPFAPLMPELAAANLEAARTRRRTLRRVVVADARRRRRP